MLTLTDFAEAKQADLPEPDAVWDTQYRALVRMLLFFTGQTHDLLAEFSEKAEKIITRAAGADGELDGLGLYRAASGLEREWNKTFDEWQKQFAQLRYEAAAIPFGGLAALHDQLVKPPADSALIEAVMPDLFDRQIQAIIDAAGQRVHRDGLQLSNRIWRLDRDALNGIKQVIYNGAASGKSAWNIAKDLEQYLGMGQGCPRWTRTRLRLTKKQIAAGDVRGLKSGDECQGQGVAYKALRLARNELQVIHGLATDTIMSTLPFVSQEQINLSPSHPVDDECDTIVRGGEGGQGIYPKGTISLPIHVHCLCFKTAVLPKPDEITDQLRGWMNGLQPWPAMDDYAALLGGDVTGSLGGLAVVNSLLLWAEGDYDQMLRLF